MHDLMRDVARRRARDTPREGLSQRSADLGGADDGRASRLEQARSVRARSTFAVAAAIALVAGCSLLDEGACSLQVFELRPDAARPLDRRPIAEPYVITLDEQTRSVFVGFSTTRLDHATMSTMDPRGAISQLIHIEGQAREWQARIAQAGVWHVRLLDETAGCLRETSIRVTGPL
jgi:hypothetical protein